MEQRNAAGRGNPISPSEPAETPAQLLPRLSQEDVEPMAGCETSKLVHDSGSSHWKTDTWYCQPSWGTIRMGHQEEQFGTVAFIMGCLEAEPKAGSGRD